VNRFRLRRGCQWNGTWRRGEMLRLNCRMIRIGSHHCRRTGFGIPLSRRKRNGDKGKENLKVSSSMLHPLSFIPRRSRVTEMSIRIRNKGTRNEESDVNSDAEGGGNAERRTDMLALVRYATDRLAMGVRTSKMPLARLLHGVATSPICKGECVAEIPGWG